MRIPLLGFMALGLLAGRRSADAGEYDGTPPGFHTPPIGGPPPDFPLLGIDGRTYGLPDFRDSPYLIVVFLSNHCPASHAAEVRFIPFVAGLKGSGVAVVAINPNSLEGLRIDELGYSK